MPHRANGTNAYAVEQASEVCAHTHTPLCFPPSLSFPSLALKLSPSLTQDHCHCYRLEVSARAPFGLNTGQ